MIKKAEIAAALRFAYCACYKFELGKPTTSVTNFAALLPNGLNADILST